MKRLLPSFRQFGRARSGAAVVEFTLVAPLLIALMCGMAEFSNAMRQYHVMEKGARDAARYLARVPMTGCTINSGSITAAQNLALTGRTAGGNFLFRTWSDPGSVTVSVAQCVDNSAGAYRGQAQMPVIEVSTSAPYADLGMLTVIGLGPITLQTSHQQLWIGE